jgi:streptomycin 6-kinase
MRGLEPLPLPRNLVAAAEAEGRTTLPATVARLAGAWSLTVGAPFQPGGQTAWVAPVRNRAGAELVVKVAWAHPEAEHEAAGLRAWAGDGAVRPHAAEESGDTIGLLLERCQPGRRWPNCRSGGRTWSSPGWFASGSPPCGPARRSPLSCTA